MSDMSRKPDTEWQKAIASGTGNPCVKVRRFDGVIEAGDTKQDPTGPVLRCTPAEFAAWLDGVKKGEFDRLVL